MKDYKYVRRTLVDMFYNTLDRQKYSEVCADTLEAVNRQIPKKPIKAKEHIRYSMCYICPNRQRTFSGTGIASYCYHCGQALDWSDIK